jgi:hypothetical protein
LLAVTLFFLAISVVPLGISFAVTPADIDSGRVQLSPPCPYKAAHGRPCLSCGLTRGFAAMSHGQLGDAKRYNPAAPWLYLAFWLVALPSAAASVRLVREIMNEGLLVWRGSDGRRGPAMDQHPNAKLGPQPGSEAPFRTTSVGSA